MNLQARETPSVNPGDGPQFWFPLHGVAALAHGSVTRAPLAGLTQVDGILAIPRALWTVAGAECSGP
jgi:hypothetical protein